MTEQRFKARNTCQNRVRETKLQLKNGKIRTRIEGFKNSLKILRQVFPIPTEELSGKLMAGAACQKPRKGPGLRKPNRSSKATRLGRRSEHNCIFTQKLEKRK